jgi:cyclopropane fatty-acyl-phospholipid synthase-like methyltransferase
MGWSSNRGKLFAHAKLISVFLIRLP